MTKGRPGSVQSELRVGHLGIDRADGRYFPAMVMAALLGGVFGSRLNYDARLSLGIDRDPPGRAAYGFNVSLRAAVGLVPNHRVVYGTNIAAPLLSRTRTSSSVTVALNRLYWLYQPKEGLSFVPGAIPFRWVSQSPPR